MQQISLLRRNARDEIYRLHLSISSDADACLQRAALETDILLCEIIGKGWDWLISHMDEALTQTQVLAFRQILRRRLEWEPIAYITGRKEFFGRDFLVGPGVLVPRPETEHLVEQAISILSGEPSGTEVIDLGTGSGAIVISVVKDLIKRRGEVFAQQYKFYAIDKSPEALEFARRNAQRHGVSDLMSFLASDGLLALPHLGLSSNQLILCNPPYIPINAALPIEVKKYEPAQALFAGELGLDYICRFSLEALSREARQTTLLMELGDGQFPTVAQFLKDSGYHGIESVEDYSGKERIIKARNLESQLKGHSA